jgi:ArsR family transcriptional regulator
MALPPDDRQLFELADFFKVFGDSTRIRILFALTGGGLCVGELADRLTLHQSAVSHQLRILKQAHLVRHNKEGKQVRYSLDDDHIFRIIDQGLEHIRE